MVDVSVIILNYKTPKMCLDCVNSLKEHSKGFSYEIIIIDNDSKDDSYEVLTSALSSSDVKFLWNKSNLGTAAAFNQGCRISNGKYLFYLNTDTLFINNAIYELLSFMEKNEKIGITGGNLYNSVNNPTHSYNRYFGKKYLNRFSSFFWFCFEYIFRKQLSLSFNYTDKNIEVYYNCAAATLIRKDVYKLVGGFDEDIFIYGDEALFAFSARNKGFLSYNVPSAKIIHFEGDSFKKEDDGFSEARYMRILKGTSTYYFKAYGEKYKQKYLKKIYKGQKIRKIIFKIIGNYQKYSYYSKANFLLKKIILGEVKLFE